MNKIHKAIIKTTKATLRSTASALLLAGAMTAFAAEPFNINIPAQKANAALLELAEAAGVQITFNPQLLSEVQAKKLQGNYTLDQALQLLLADTGLIYQYESDDMVVVKQGGMSAKKPGDGIVVDVGGRALIEEIIVTAQKREQRLIDVPMSVFARTGEDLNESGVTDLQSLSLTVPGMFVDETGTVSRRITIRGVGNLIGSSSLVGLYLDDAAVTASGYYQIDLRVHDIERVEVLKGPQPTLYGEGSVGGTIRYITKDPVLDNFEGSVSADTSFTKDGDASHEMRGVVNIPLVEDRLGLRVVGQYIDSGGWIDQPARDLTDINDFELFNIRTKLLWRPIDGLDVEGTAIVHRNNSGAENTGEDEDGNYRQAFDDDSTPSAEDDYDLYSLSIDYDLGGVSLISSTSYLDVQNDIRNFGNQCCVLTDVPGVSWNVLRRENRSSAEIFTQELRVSTNGAGPLNGHLGAFYRDATIKADGVDELLFGVPSGGTFGVDLFSFSGFSEERSESLAIFGELSYVIIDDLEVGAGLRYFEDDRRFRNATSAALLAGAPFVEAKFDSLNPRFFVSYGVTEEIRIYANAAKGFRSGGLNADGEPPFGPESFWSYEVGSKVSGLNGRLNAEVALFHGTFDDYQIFDLDLEKSVFGLVANSGKARIRGVDASLAFQVTENLELGVTGNYTDTEFTEIVDTVASHAVGDPLDLVPEYGFSLWGDYSFTWPDHRPGFARLDYSQQGRADFRLRHSGEFSTSDIIDMMNARIGWRHNNWSAELYATNLLNERGFIGASSIQLKAARPRPRTIGIKIGVDF